MTPPTGCVHLSCWQIWPGARSARVKSRRRSLHKRSCAGEELTYHARSEEHTSELQSPCNLVCRLLLEKKKTEQSCLACRTTPPVCKPRSQPRYTSSHTAGGSCMWASHRSGHISKHVAITSRCQTLPSI